MANIIVSFLRNVQSHDLTVPPFIGISYAFVVLPTPKKLYKMSQNSHASSLLKIMHASRTRKAPSTNKHVRTWKSRKDSDAQIDRSQLQVRNGKETVKPELTAKMKQVAECNFVEENQILSRYPLSELSRMYTGTRKWVIKGNSPANSYNSSGTQPVITVFEKSAY